MRHLTPILSLVVVMMLLSIGCERDKVKEFGSLKLGLPAPEKPGDSTSYPYKNIPPSGFYIYVVQESLSIDCVYGDCGHHGEIVECLGGWLSGNSTTQAEIAWIYGLNEGNATSIIVVADQDSKIVGIYPNYTMQNLPEILKRHVDLIDFGRFTEKCHREEQIICCGCGHE
ncbi:hypothetical protein WDW89_18235 [Deltaproteobacteria bacterium TL4]